MNIAVVGGGSRCVRLIEVLSQHHFQEIQPRIVAVVDIDPEAPGYLLAQQKGIHTATDYSDLYQRRDLDLIIELTGKIDVFHDILHHKDEGMRLISSRTVQLFWEISSLSLSHKKVSQELQEARATFKLIMDEMIQEDVMIISYNYKIIEINRSLLQKLGLNREEVIGRHCYEITHRRDLPCSGENHPCPLIKTLESGKPYQTTHTHLDKDERLIYYSISTYPMLEDGDVIGAIEISRDITKDINVQKTLLQQEKLASIGRLSAGVAHEINNPLTTILTSALLVQEDLSPDDPAYEELGLIAKEALRCRKIVASLLDFARQTQPQKKMHHLNHIVAESVLLTQKQAAFKDIGVDTHLDPAIPEQMLDKGQLQQALINLILNAVEATPEGGRITVRTQLRHEKKSVHIDIEDNGAGIHKDQLNKIFEPFFTTKESGTGLGLSITHGFIEQHGGTIKVESTLGQGTRFIIHLPISEEKA
jgi:two-component system, NtrC family, sensor kinase